MAAGTEAYQKRVPYYKAYYLKNKERIDAYDKAHRLANPDQHKRNLRKARYELDEETYQNMLTEQKGLCKICKVEMNPPHVDHCHETNKVRGLLCDTCNRGIGFLKEDIKILESAIIYLTRKRG